MKDNVLDKAVALIKSGDVNQGGALLIALLQEEPRNEKAWIWLYACVGTNEQRKHCLEKILEINPSNTKIQNVLDEFKTLEGNEQQAENGDQNISKKKSSKKKLKPSQPFSQSDTKENEISPIPPENIRGINPYDYKVIFTKDGDNFFSVSKLNFANFPSIDSTMIGSRLLIDGVFITPYDYPECIRRGYIPQKSVCYVCEFFAESDCPIRKDWTILNETRIFFTQRNQHTVQNIKHRLLIINTIYSELKEHGRPLHYELLAQIVIDRYPDLELNSKKILRYMTWHPEKFESVGSGVYKSK